MDNANTKMRQVIIVCEDTFGLDIYMIVRAINVHARRIRDFQYDVIGFIADKGNPFGEIKPPVPVLGSVFDWIPDKAVTYIMGMRDPKKKEQIAKLLKARGADFETIIAPWVLLPSEFEAGEGCIIGNYNCKYKSKFGDFVTLDTVMCETVEVGDYSTLCAFANITSAKIGEGVYVGSHSAIMSHKTIGDGSYILPGSVVVTNIKKDSVVAGVPATTSAVKDWK